jgi:hypothetical protein
MKFSPKIEGERGAVSSDIERRRKANVSNGSGFDVKAETMPV